MTTILVVDGLRPFYAEADTVKTEAREYGNVISAAGRWTPDGVIAWESWAADRVEIRTTSITDHNEGDPNDVQPKP